MINELEEKNNEKIPILWQVFRHETGYIFIPTKIIERIKLRIKEKIDEKNNNY